MGIFYQRGRGRYLTHVPPPRDFLFGCFSHLCLFSVPVYHIPGSNSRRAGGIFLFSEAKKRCAVFSFSAHLPEKCSACFRVFCLASVRIMRSYVGKYPKINKNIENISKLFFQPGQVLSGLTVIIKTWGQNRWGDGAALTQIHTSRKGEKAKRKSKGKMKPKAKPASRPQKSREQKNAASR